MEPEGTGSPLSCLWGCRWPSALALISLGTFLNHSSQSGIDQISIITILNSNTFLDCFLLRSSVQMERWASARVGILIVTLARRKDTDSHTSSFLILLVIKAALVQILKNICSVFLQVCGRKRFIGAFKDLWISFPESLPVHPFTHY